MALSHSIISFLLLSALLTTSSSKPDPINGGFSVPMIHRDSPKSPLFNPSQTHFQRVANALRRSITRARRFTAAAGTADAPVFNNRGEYLMEISLGTPPVPILAVPDTGSDNIWTQCAPCSKCYRQSAPLFDPRKSSTYRILPCNSPMCSISDRSFCAQSHCWYAISYGDGSHSSGDMAAETVTMGTTTGRQVSFPATVIGCGHDNGGTFDANVSGIIGLARGRESLPSQMGPNLGRFSYCLAPIDTQSLNSGKINFGSSAVVAGAGTVSTPVFGRDKDSFYMLSLEAVSVGMTRIAFEAGAPTPAAAGNIIIDSGTTVTMLPVGFFAKFSSAIAAGIKLERVKDPNGILEMCFRSVSDGIGAPAITFHFQGADVVLSSTNLFLRVAEDVLCLAFVPVENGTPIYGNVAQSNFLVGYDAANRMVSFRPSDCAAM